MKFSDRLESLTGDNYCPSDSQWQPIVSSGLKTLCGAGFNWERRTTTPLRHKSRWRVCNIVLGSEFREHESSRLQVSQNGRFWSTSVTSFGFARPCWSIGLRSISTGSPRFLPSAQRVTNWMGLYHWAAPCFFRSDNKVVHLCRGRTQRTVWRTSKDWWIFVIFAF